MYNSVRRVVATVQCVVLSHFMLNEHINTSAVPHGVTGKTIHLVNGSVVANIVMHGSGKHWQRAIHLHTMQTLSHSLHTVTPPCPLVTNRQDRRESRLKDTDTHINMHMSGLGSELGPELGHF